MSIVNIGMTALVKKIYWLLLDRCTECGGELEIWDIKKAFCSECKTRN